MRLKPAKAINPEINNQNAAGAGTEVRFPVASELSKLAGSKNLFNVGNKVKLSHSWGIEGRGKVIFYTGETQAQCKGFTCDPIFRSLASLPTP